MILLLDHDQNLAALLRAKGYAVDAFLGGCNAYDNLSRKLYDLALINLDSDDGEVSGWALAQAVKSRFPGMPVFGWLGDGRRQSVLKAYQSGCDEVFRQPFFPEEVFIKIGRVLDPLEAVELPGGYRYLSGDHRVFGHGGEVALTGTERKLMHLLVQNLGKVVPAEVIEEAIWECETSEACRHTLLSRMRKKLGKTVIRTVPRIGYTIEAAHRSDVESQELFGERFSRPGRPL